MLALLKHHPVALALYLVTLIAIVVGTVRARQQTLITYGTVQAQADWNKWREEASGQTNEGTVSRRQPRSAEPPALVLMRDHFTAVLWAGVVFGSLLYMLLAIVVVGATAKPAHPAEEQPFRRE